MNPFTYERASNSAAAVDAFRATKGSRYIGGGTNLLDLMKEDVEHADHLVDVNPIEERTITVSDQGVLRIGAAVSNSAAADDANVLARAPLLSEAILAGASPQLRNMATCGGNLLQRTRCYYFYDTATACNKRELGQGCDAALGYNRIHAVLGASGSCVAVHPSDFCVALAALDAVVLVRNGATRGGEEKRIAFRDFHRLPENDPTRDTVLESGDLIVALEIPAGPAGFARNHHYLKTRDRNSYAFALASAAVALEFVPGSERIARAQVAMGGMAHKPWRDFEAERLLQDRPATRETYRTFADAFFRDARPLKHNAFKIELGKATLVRALEEAANPERKTR